jgi:hypothetical protein
MHAWLSALAMAAPIECALTIGSSDREVVASLSNKAVVREWRQRGRFRESAVVPRLVTRRSAFTKVQQATASPWR